MNLMATASDCLIDTFGRTHNNLRISVTDRCNLRCTYCMPEEVVFLDRSALLTFEEIAHFVRVAAPLGIDKVRLTGGEPLMRRHLDRLVRLLVPIPGIKDIGLTTNGLLLADHGRKRSSTPACGESTSAWIRWTPEAFREISRRDGLEAVLAGIEAAQRAGFAPIKINAVIIRGVNDQDVVPLARYCREHGLEMRFIEYMPIGAEHVGARQGLFRPRNPGAAGARRSRRWCPRRTTIRVPRRWTSSTPTAAAGWA